MRDEGGDDAAAAEGAEPEPEPAEAPDWRAQMRAANAARERRGRTEGAPRAEPPVSASPSLAAPAISTGGFHQHLRPNATVTVLVPGRGSHVSPGRQGRLLQRNDDGTWLVEYEGGATAAVEEVRLRRTRVGRQLSDSSWTARENELTGCAQSPRPSALPCRLVANMLLAGAVGCLCSDDLERGKGARCFPPRGGERR